jgi:VWFA-related protein
MFQKLALSAMLLGVLTALATAQTLRLPTPGDSMTTAMSIDAIQAAQLDFSIFTVNSQDPSTTPLQGPGGALSKLDLKAPSKAQREYDKGYQLLLRKDAQSAVQHLGQAVAIYSNYVAAHNALGTAYLNLNQNDQARNEFAKAVELDDHLPNSYLNLGCAQLALKDYPGAEASFEKASSIAPLDLQLSTARAYGEYANKDFPAVLETVKAVHSRKHKGAALVHYFAAGAWEAEGNLAEAQRELEILLEENPKSPSAEQFRQTLAGIKAEEARLAEAKLHPAKVPEPVKFSFSEPAATTSEEATRHAQQVLQDVRERSEIAEAEAAAPVAPCADCNAPTAGESSPVPAPVGLANRSVAKIDGPVFRASVDEVAIFFSATDHGKSVTDLTPEQVVVRDDSQAPEAIHAFRNEAQLPLRLGLIIDTSNSVTGRFSFEQGAAAKFLEKVFTNKDDLAFVLGVNNSVLLVQDFTGDQSLTSRAVNKLAPSGGTALWDAIEFAADKLASRTETQPVARMLVVISDGEDNSSSESLKEAIATAQKGEVAIYTVSTKEALDEDPSAVVGARALKALAELTGGATFVPGSVRRLNGSLNDVQQVIRGRYFVSYKPAKFQRNGHYRPIQITAQKDGHSVKVYARTGYYALTPEPETTQ